MTIAFALKCCKSTSWGSKMCLMSIIYCQSDYYDKKFEKLETSDECLHKTIGLIMPFANGLCTMLGLSDQSTVQKDFPLTQQRFSENEG